MSTSSSLRGVSWAVAGMTCVIVAGFVGCSEQASTPAVSTVGADAEAAAVGDEQRQAEAERVRAYLHARYEREFRSLTVPELEIGEPQIATGQPISVTGILRTSDESLFAESKPRVMAKVKTLGGIISDETTPELVRRDDGAYEVRAELEGPPFAGDFYVALEYVGGKEMSKVPLAVRN